MPPEKRKPEEEPEAAKSPAVSTHHEVTQPASAPPPSTTQATSSEVATGSPAKSGPYKRREIPARKRTKRGDGKKTEFEQGEELESGDGEEAKSNVQGTKAGAENKNSGGGEAKRSRKSTQHRSFVTRVKAAGLESINPLKKRHKDGSEESKYVFEDFDEEFIADNDSSWDDDDSLDGEDSSEGQQESLILVHEHRYKDNEQESRGLCALDRNLVTDLAYLSDKIRGLSEEYKWNGTYQLEFKGIRLNQQTGNFEKETIWYTQPETFPDFLKRVFHINLYQISSGDGEKTSANSSATDDVKFRLSSNNDPSTKKEAIKDDKSHKIISKEFHPYFEWSADADADLPPLQCPLIDKEGNIDMAKYEDLISHTLMHLMLGMYTENEAKGVLRHVLKNEMEITMEDHYCGKLLELLVLDKHVRLFRPDSGETETELMKIARPTMNWTIERFIVCELSAAELVKRD
ncbi:uncharacterized protein LOC121050102 [Rosa chinensis]|uniref:uncharacterized protein LOC121050102 n=1 Tax=Rosa chinensis TaxID=74649 RepID=UPI001AD8BDA8|nr:uncharacterized protein LOC121050102 [Rosa chinensis]